MTTKNNIRPKKYLPKLFLATLLIFSMSSCSAIFHHFDKQPAPPQNSEPTLVKKKRAPQKENLEFAFAGGQREIQLPEPANTDSVKIQKKKIKKAVRRNDKISSRFQAMIEKARLLRLEKERETEQLLTAATAPAAEVFTEEAPEEFVAEHPLPQKTPGTYDELIHQLRSGREPVKIMIGRGKKYWVGSIASKIFPYGSAEYHRVLEWIVQNNRYYHKTHDLNMVRVGDEVLFPAKTMITEQLANNG